MRITTVSQEHGLTSHAHHMFKKQGISTFILGGQTSWARPTGTSCSLMRGVTLVVSRKGDAKITPTPHDESCSPLEGQRKPTHCWKTDVLSADRIATSQAALEVKRAREGPFRLVCQALFVAPHNDDPRKDEEYRQREGNRANRSGHPVDIVAEQVAPHAVERGPDDASGRIEEQEAWPAHAVGSGQKGGPGTQQPPRSARRRPPCRRA